ncbi:MAG: hypothetical protein Q8N87_00350 [bacterium]|nr:hypothetical protein [bacterium]
MGIGQAAGWIQATGSGEVVGIGQAAGWIQAIGSGEVVGIGQAAGWIQVIGKTAAQGLAPLLLIIVVEINSGENIAAPEVVQELLARRLVTTIIRQKTVAQGLAPLLLIIVVEINSGENIAALEVVQELIARRLLTTIICQKTVPMAVQKGNARKRDGVCSIVNVRIVILVLGLNVNPRRGLRELFVE